MPTTNRHPLTAAILLLAALLAGCPSTPTRPGAPLPADLQQLDRWQARGRLGVSGPENGGTGSFEWRQRGDRSDVQIRGPVGIGGVSLEMRGAAPWPDLKLHTSDGQTLESAAAWSELEARLGAPVPAGNLRYWMLGLPAPEGEYRWDGEATLIQDGWRIDYQQYSDDAGAHVPVRMSATSGQARVRIVVDRWQLGQ